MTKRVLAIAAGGIAVALAAFAGYIWLSGGSGEPSTEVTAPPVTAAAADDGATDTTPSTVPSAESTTSAPSTETTAAPSAETTVYTLVKEESLASFTLEEDLRGQRTEVVGTTSELAAEILVDFADPANSQLGEVVINARTLDTGSSFRDRAIRSEILESASDEFEFITFTPTAVDGLPDQVADGVTFTVTGDLTIRTITRPVTFEVTVTQVTDSRLEGSATAQVLRSDFDLNIPSVPQVANVTDEVGLSIAFVAEAA